MARPRSGADVEDDSQLVLGGRLFGAPPLNVDPVVVPPPAPKVYGVGELVRAARLTMEARFSDFRVEGEISGFKRSGPGHLYFTLKDGEAQLDCVMFAREAARLKVPIDEGMMVRCRGRLTIYEGRGKFQMSVTEADPAGAGALAVAFELLKKRLSHEGLFAAERKRPIPFLPRRIGVVTSPQGAVIRDIVRVAERRFPVPILLSPANVQGVGAAAQIVMALRRLQQVTDVDVIIIARGGGSMEDLWAFNDEALARAIAACRVPVISAVGHETDFTIADFVADLRAPTPSAAAERVVPVLTDLQAELAIVRNRLHRGATAHVGSRRLRLERMRGRLGEPRRLLDEKRQRLDDLVNRGASLLRVALTRRRQGLRAVEARLYRAHPQRRIADQRAVLVQMDKRLRTAETTLLTRRRLVLSELGGKLQALSPLRVLDRGYSVARLPDGRVLGSVANARPGQELRITLRDGEIEARVTDSKPKSDS